MTSVPKSGYTSDKLSHFVGRGKTEDEAFETLVKILKEGKLVHRQTADLITTVDGVTTIANPGHSVLGQVSVSTGSGTGPDIEIKGLIKINPHARISKNEMINPQMICFCDIPIEHLSIHSRKYGRFGLCFDKAFLLNQGVTPVFYVANEAIGPDLTRSKEEELEREEEAESRLL
jgi:hypothetical protein